MLVYDGIRRSNVVISYVWQARRPMYYKTGFHERSEANTYLFKYEYEDPLILPLVQYS